MHATFFSTLDIITIRRSRDSDALDMICLYHCNHHTQASVDPPTQHICTYRSPARPLRYLTQKSALSKRDEHQKKEKKTKLKLYQHPLTAHCKMAIKMVENPILDYRKTRLRCVVDMGDIFARHCCVLCCVLRCVYVLVIAFDDRLPCPCPGTKCGCPAHAGHRHMHA